MTNAKIKEFENYHNIRIKENWNDGENCVLNLIKLREKIQLTMSNLKDDDFHKYPTVGIILQLIERIYEQITGSISCVCTKNHSSSGKVKGSGDANANFYLNCAIIPQGVANAKETTHRDSRVLSYHQ